MTTKHTHAANFGRHVDGCPRCEELKAGAKPIAWKGSYKAQQQQRQIDAIRRHVCSAKCGVVCTFGDY